MVYSLILIVVFIVAVLIDIKHKIRPYTKLTDLYFALALFALAIICDSWLVSNDFIIFNADKLLGIKIGFLPLEEYIFYLVLPYSVLVLHGYFHKKLK